MILTGKAKEDFKNWCIKNNHDKVDIKYNRVKEIEKTFTIFQSALIIDFFDSVGVHIHIEPFYYKKQLYFKQYILGYKDINEQNTYLKRIDATEEAIKKANEIYNKN